MDMKQLYRNFLGYSRGAKGFLVLSTLDGFAMLAFWFTLMLYLYHLNMSLISIGIIAALGTYVASFTQFFSGYIADKIGRKRVLLVGTLLAAVSVWLFLLKPHIAVFAIASIIHGFSMAIMMPAQNAFISEKTSRTKRKFLFSLNAFFRQMGSAFSLLTIILFVLFMKDLNISTTATFQLFYLTYVIVYVFKILCCILIPEKYDHKRSWSWVIPKSWRVMVKFGITNLVIGIGAGIMVPWFPVFFKVKFEVSLLTLAVVFLINAVVWAVCVLIIPIFADRFGSIRTIVVAQGLAILVILVIPNSPYFLMAALFFIVRIVLMNIAVPITNAFQLNLVKLDERGTLTGFLFFSWQIAQATGTFIGGAFYYYIVEGIIPISVPFYITAGFYVIYIVMFWLFFHKMEKKGSGN